MGTLINGKELAEKMQAAFLSETATLKEQGVTPGLVVLLVGEDKASQTYVKNKELAAAKIGINSRVARYPESITEAELLAEIEQFNNDDAFHGILVQLPLPKHINEEKVLLAIKPEKDVDGFHPINLGKLFAGVPDRIPCTPLWHYENVCCVWDRIGREKCLSDRSQQHCRKTNGALALGGKCHRDYCSFKNQKSARVGKTSGHFSRGDRPRSFCHKRLRKRRGCGD